ncbi:MAG: Uncharacterized MFS-type transporter, partial [uncultured Friedmanniella sp.]
DLVRDPEVDQSALAHAEPPSRPARRRHVLHGEPGRHDHRHCCAGHGGRPRGGRGRHQPGHDGLPGHHRRRHPDQRLADRPLRRPPGAQQRDRHLHRGLAALCPQHQPPHAGGDADPAGDRRRADGAGGAAGGAAGDLQAGLAGRRRLPHLAGVGGAGHRARARRLDRHRGQLAVDLPDQPAARRLRPRGRGADRARAGRRAIGAAAGLGGLQPLRRHAGRPADRAGAARSAARRRGARAHHHPAGGGPAGRVDCPLATADPASAAAFRGPAAAVLPGQQRGWRRVPDGHLRGAVPAAADVPDRLRLVTVPCGSARAAAVRRQRSDQAGDQPADPDLRLPQRAHREHPRWAGHLRGDRDAARRHPAAHDRRRPGAQWDLPLGRVQRLQLPAVRRPGHHRHDRRQHLGVHAAAGRGRAGRGHRGGHPARRRPRRRTGVARPGHPLRRRLRRVGAADAAPAGRGPGAAPRGRQRGRRSV